MTVEYDYQLNYYGNYVNDTLSTNNVITINVYEDLFATSTKGDYLIPDSVLTGYTIGNETGNNGYSFAAKLSDELAKKIVDGYVEGTTYERPIKLIRVLNDSEENPKLYPAGLYQYICANFNNDGYVDRDPKCFILCDADGPVFTEGYKSPQTLGFIKKDDNIGGLSSNQLFKKMLGQDKVTPPTITATIKYNDTKTDPNEFKAKEVYTVGDNSITIGTVKLSAQYENGQYYSNTDNSITDIIVEDPNITFKIGDDIKLDEVSLPLEKQFKDIDHTITFDKLGKLYTFNVSSTSEYYDQIAKQDKIITPTGGYSITCKQYPIYYCATSTSTNISNLTFNNHIGSLSTSLSTGTKFTTNVFKVPEGQSHYFYILISKLFTDEDSSTVGASSIIEISESGSIWTSLNYVGEITRDYSSGIEETYCVYKADNSFSAGTYTYIVRIKTI